MATGTIKNALAAGDFQVSTVGSSYVLSDVRAKCKNNRVLIQFLASSSWTGTFPTHNKVTFASIPTDYAPSVNKWGYACSLDANGCINHTLSCFIETNGKISWSTETAFAGPITFSCTLEYDI